MSVNPGQDVQKHTTPLPTLQRGIFCTGCARSQQLMSCQKSSSNGGKDTCLEVNAYKECRPAFHACPGGLPRARLVRDFVVKVFVPEMGHDKNKVGLHECICAHMPRSQLEAKLEAMIKLRQMTREWRKGVQGYEWLTKSEMKERSWPEYFGLQMCLLTAIDSCLLLMCLFCRLLYTSGRRLKVLSVTVQRRSCTNAACTRTS